MDEITSDLLGVAVYLDDILCSGATAEVHLQNLRRLLERLCDEGLRCRLEKCTFAQPQVVYLGHVLSSEGIHQGPKVNALNEMPAPHDVFTLRSFLGYVLFYAKFLPPTFASVAEPLYRLTRQGHRWAWGSEEEAAFRRLKELLSAADVLAHLIHPFH